MDNGLAEQEWRERGCGVQYTVTVPGYSGRYQYTARHDVGAVEICFAVQYCTVHIRTSTRYSTAPKLSSS